MSAIPFTQIPLNNRVPFYFVEFDSSNSGVAGNGVQNSLLIGQTGNAALAPLPMFVPSVQWAANTFGVGSQLAIMVAAYFQGDPEGALYALPLVDAVGSAAATATVTIVGTATANGTLFLMVSGREVQVGVISGNSASAIASAVAAGVNNYSDSNGLMLPVTAAAVSGVVTLTCRSKGAVGNQINVQLNFFGSAAGEAIPAGITVAIAAMSGGATDPDLAGIGAALGGTAYDFIALAGYNGLTQLGEMTAAMSFSGGGRWSYASQLYGHVFTSYRDSDDGSAVLAFVANLNDPHMTVIGFESTMPNSPFEVAASFMGAFAQASKADPARPSQTLTCPLLIPPSNHNGFGGISVLQSLLSAGVALMQYPPGGNVEILRTVTTYVTNQWGQPDQSYLDAEILFTLMYYVRNQKANLTQKFPRAKLAQDGLNFGQQGNFGNDTPPIVTPKVMKAELIVQYSRMCPGGDLVTLMQDPTDYAAGLQVQINGSNPNRLDILDDPILVGGLRMIAVLNQFQLIVPSAGG